MNSTMRNGLLGLMAILICIVLLLIGISLGVAFTGEMKFVQDTAATWIAAIATVVIALLTIFLAFETQAMRRLQKEQIDGIRADAIRPHMDVFLMSSSANFNFADLVLRNNGSGLARNIRIKFRHISDRGTKTNAEDLMDKLSRPSFIANGVSTLGPGREYSSYILSFVDLTDKENKDYFDVALEVSISCEDSDGMSHIATAIVDLAEFKGISVIGGKPLHDTAKELKKIRETLGHISSGFKKISVNTYTSSDREEDERRVIREFEESKKQRGLSKSES